MYRKVLIALVATVPLLASEPQKIEKKGRNGTELADLDFLIAGTEKSLERQRELREKIIRFQELKGQSMEHEEDYELLFKLSKSAHSLLESIKDEHLIQVFDPTFISELTLLSKPASRRAQQ